MLHAIAANLNTESAKDTATFLQEFLNFEIENKSGNWWAGNGSVYLHLTEDSSKRPGTLLVQSTNFDADIAKAEQHSHLTPSGEVTQEQNTLSRLFHCTCGINILIFHELDEDERGELIPLPTSLEWPEDVALCTQHILTVTPVSFREKARLEATEKAEYYAVSEGNLHVSMANAMKGLCDITPQFQHRALFEAMESEGIDANQFLDPSSWENETYV